MNNMKGGSLSENGRSAMGAPEFFDRLLKVCGRMTDGVTNPMRVDTSLLQGIAAANQAAQAKSTSLKSTGTTTTFSSALKSATSASEKETTKAVDGQNYSEILTGPRAGMYLNTGSGARDGEAFVLVKHDGREDHIYGTGKDRKVVSVGAEKASSDSSPSTDKTSTTDKSSSSTSKAPANETTKAVAGRGYADILSGKRSGLYLNTSGNVRDGDVFALVKREGREFHIYGSGDDRSVYEVGRQRAAAGTSQGSGTTTAATGSTGTTGS
jgi:hypothetical protein